jgi:AcrR family transcriptional regulator
MPRAFNDHEKRTIHAQLLAAGRKHFDLYGLSKTRVEELAQAVGISKGAFYLFYESKEALFMEVVEAAERDFQQEVLAAVELPGPTPHARLYAVLHKAFTLWKTIPILRIFTHADYAILARRVPPESFRAHLQSDRGFIETLITRCQAAGLPLQVAPEELDGLLHTLFFASLHEDDFGAGALTASLELLLHLTVAYCLGAVAMPETVRIDQVGR